MKNLAKYKKQILMGVLIIIGVISIVFGKNAFVQCGITSISWGLAVIIIALITKQNNEQELAKFDLDAKNILEDIAERGEESEFYGYYNIDMVSKIRVKLVKRQKKQFISCVILGVVLLITAIICII